LYLTGYFTPVFRPEEHATEEIDSLADDDKIKPKDNPFEDKSETTPIVKSKFPIDIYQNADKDIGSNNIPTVRVHTESRIDKEQGNHTVNDMFRCLCNTSLHLVTHCLHIAQ